MPNLRVGVGAFFQYSFFSNGNATLTFSIAEALEKLGHTPILININQTSEWYEDCNEIKTKYERRNLAEWDEKKYDQLDVFIDIDGFLIPKYRRQIGKRVLVFLKKPFVISETEHLVYPVVGPVRNIVDCDGILTFDHFGKQDAHVIKMISEKPVYRLPFFWTSSAVEAHSKQLPSWLEKSREVNEWRCHVVETNRSLTSSAILPIVIASYLKRNSPELLVNKCIVHNSTELSKNDFFEQNIHNNSKQEGLDYEFVGRQRIGDFRMFPKSFILFHTRFNIIKPRILDALWAGIPFVHNSPWLKTFGNGLERYYYSDNSIREATTAIKQLFHDYDTKDGIFKEGCLQKIQEAILEYINPRKASDIWNSALIQIEDAKQPSAPAQIVNIPSKSSDSTKSATEIKKELIVGISDFHESFNYTYNFWTLFLQEACSKLAQPIDVKTIEITEKNVHEKIDLLIFGPFGNVWLNVPEHIPKVHTTGEPTGNKYGNGVFLNLGFEPTDESKGSIRFPLWMVYIDWFGADQSRIVNPKSMPVDAFTTISKDMLERKSKFCAFIVTNPGNKMRNDAFHWLNDYKPVDSAGRLFNTVGDAIFTSIPGGGGGELAKMEFLKDYKFSITYENSRGDGYITEKLVAAKAAGCVPIYWGAPNPYEDFAEGSFINANDARSKEELIAMVKEIDQNQEKWMTMASKPAIDIEKQRKKLADIAKVILKKILGEDVGNQLPTKLGASSCTEANLLAVKREANKKLTKPLQEIQWNGKTLLVTFATQKFLQSLSYWLGAIEVRAKVDPSIFIRVYLGDDIDDQNMNIIRSEHPNVDLRRLPTKTYRVDSFPDLWEPQHFAWKLWIYQELVQEQSLANTLIWYSDAGSMIVRWPNEWFEITRREGLCMLEDKEQKNEQWCHPHFCARMAVKPEEMAAQQVVGGIMAFMGGSKMAWKIFSEAWVFAQNRHIIVGPKWSGFLPDGRPFGHRHDQSILSILRLRHKVPVFPLEKVYNHESLRRTFKSGAALYVHRGIMKENENFKNRIGEVHIISLARRNDRIQRFKQNHDSWTKMVCLRPAFDGRKLKLTPALAGLFAPNDFHWKKSVMGCALSHLSLWFELANEPPSCENYLILEDDVKFNKDWLDIWEKASNHIPEDYDVLYLGGVLPPNKESFSKLQEPVNEYWNRIAPNQIFGQASPSRYFHFCNYSYILSRKGAQKILEGLQQHGGYHTSADHMICNRVQDMVHYVLNPQVAGCYQDEDPKYAKSEFNNFSRIDNFDSDLWNNDERFSEQEIKENMLQLKPDFRLSIGQIIYDTLYATQNTSETQVQPSIAPAPVSTITQTPDLNDKSILRNLYTVGDHKLNKGSLLEYSWLEEIFGDGINAMTQLPIDHEPLSNTPVFFCMKPHLEDYYQVFYKYESAERDFIVVHLSDELYDPLDFYSLKHCKKIIRFYPRENIPCPEKVYIIPLGPYRRNTMSEDDKQNRNVIWSFFGTKWFDREALLQPLQKISPNNCKFYDTWLQADQLKAEEYSNSIRQTIFVPCPAGQNVETFRFWEALEHGAIPIYVRNPKDGEYFKFISSKLPVISLTNWESATSFIQSLLHNPQTLINHRKAMLEKWSKWKQEIKATCFTICKGDLKT
jgi:GR25 family glycosyltransferase involved in LPS biosynthesis